MKLREAIVGNLYQLTKSAKDQHASGFDIVFQLTEILYDKDDIFAEVKYKFIPVGGSVGGIKVDPEELTTEIDFTIGEMSLEIMQPYEYPITDITDIYEEQ